MSSRRAWSVAAAAVVIAGSPALPAAASSDAAWSEFRTAVTTACTVKAKALFTDPIVLVDAYGSASYGIALIYGRPQTPHGTPQLPGLESVVCVYDKHTKKAELSGPIETNFASQ